MAKEKSKNTTEATSLPAYTTIDNIFRLIEALKRKNCVEKDAKAVFGMGSSAFTNTRSALRTFGIIKEENCEFTDFGLAIAYSKDDDKKAQLQVITKKYLPYESLLINAFQKGFVTETTAEEIINFWGRFKYGSSQRNMSDGATLFMSIIEYLGYGKYVSGRAGKQTRIVWSEGIDKVILGEAEETPVAETTTAEPIETTLLVETTPQSNEEVEAEQEVQQEIVARPNEVMPIQVTPDYNASRATGKTIAVPNITINVDMTTWSEDKIESFFRYAYGLFKEEK